MGDSDQFGDPLFFQWLDMMEEARQYEAFEKFMEWIPVPRKKDEKHVDESKKKLNEIVDQIQLMEEILSDK